MLLVFSCYNMANIFYVTETLGQIISVNGTIILSGQMRVHYENGHVDIRNSHFPMWTEVERQVDFISVALNNVYPDTSTVR